MMSFPALTLLFVQIYSCLCNKKKIARWLEDMNFIFSGQKTAVLVCKILLLPLENKATGLLQSWVQEALLTCPTTCKLGASYFHVKVPREKPLSLGGLAIPL